MTATTNKQQTVNLNTASVHLSAFIDFANMFIRCRSKQIVSELSLLATEMVFTTVLFPIKKLLLENKSLNKFCRCLLKNYTLHPYLLNSTQVCFYTAYTSSDWNSLHAKLKSHYKAWSNKKKHKKIKTYR